MLKKLIMVNGTMGVGKTALCNELLKLLEPSVFLDGDWCWNMNPFIVNDETKALVIDNITYLLRNYLSCSVYEYVIFCWVMHQESIINDILNHFTDLNFEHYKITLLCSEESLINRLKIDIDNNIRTEDIIKSSVKRLTLYKNMDTVKIDVSKINAQLAARQVLSIIGNK